jgi:hypothetical protein
MRIKAEDCEWLLSDLAAYDDGDQDLGDGVVLFRCGGIAEA